MMNKIIYGTLALLVIALVGFIVFFGFIHLEKPDITVNKEVPIQTNA